MDAHVIIEHITSAFSDTRLGDGIGLWQTRAIDDYESEEVQQEMRLNDEKEDW